MSVEPVTGVMRWTSGQNTSALEFQLDEVATALSRMWSRLARAVGQIPDGDFERPTRCTEWRVVDLVNHLTDINEVGMVTAAGALQGERTGVFAGFDPRTTPNQRIGAAGREPATARRRLIASIEAMLPGIDSLDAGTAATPSESPLGRQPLAVSTLHLLWDTWLHERDLLIPLGLAPPELEDEVRLCALYTLRMVGGIAQLFQQDTRAALRLHGAWDGAMLVEVRGGDMSARLLDSGEDAGPCLEGDAATAVDALCGRGDIAAVLQGPDELRGAVSALRMVLAGS